VGSQLTYDISDGASRLGKLAQLQFALQVNVAVARVQIDLVLGRTVPKPLMRRVHQLLGPINVPLREMPGKHQQIALTHETIKAEVLRAEQSHVLDRHGPNDQVDQVKATISIAKHCIDHRITVGDARRNGVMAVLVVDSTLLVDMKRLADPCVRCLQGEPLEPVDAMSFGHIDTLG
jgi:hypothetical protein